MGLTARCTLETCQGTHRRRTWRGRSATTDPYAVSGSHTIPPGLPSSSSKIRETRKTPSEDWMTRKQVDYLYSIGMYFYSDACRWIS